MFEAAGSYLLTVRNSIEYTNARAFITYFNSAVGGTNKGIWTNGAFSSGTSFTWSSPFTNLVSSSVSTYWCSPQVK